MKPEELIHVCNTVVKKDLCSGCGICAGTCPEKALNMVFNDYGEYNPVLTGTCSGCGLCIRVCPFNEKKNGIAERLYGNVEGINVKPETGYYLESYSGFSKASLERLHGASGGLATHVLSKLLQTGAVDKVICVGKGEGDRLFDFTICDSVESVRECSKSAYYPVELSKMISYILEYDFRYAITGLPCLIDGLRNAMQQNRKLRERIIFLIGLTCGQSKSSLYLKYICVAGGGDPQSLKEIVCRVKVPNRKASDYGFSFKCEKGDVRERVLYMSEGIQEIWSADFFKLNACNYCEDVFAEHADITFMDAWLPEYTDDSSGTSLMLIRSPDLAKLVKNNLDAEIRNIDIQKVIDSQIPVLQAKRQLIRYRRNYVSSYTQVSSDL